MKIRYILPLFFTSVMYAATFVEVTGDRVNLRSAAGMPSEVVGQVNKGDLLELQGNVSDPWVKVTPPQTVDLWISSQFVENGVIVGNRVRVRAGSSVNYKDVGIVEKGTKVEVRGKVGDWVKIAPPKNTAVWITNSYVRATKQAQPASTIQPIVSSKQPAEAKPVIPVKPVEKTETKPVAPKPVEQVANYPQPQPQVKPQPQAKPQATTKPQIAKEENKETPKKVRRTFFGKNDQQVDNTPVGPAKIPSSLLREDCKQAANGVYTGRLEVSPKNAPAKFRLVRNVPNSRLAETECYVIGNAAQLNSVLGQSFTFEGPIYWFKGTSAPTVYTQSIRRVR